MFWAALRDLLRAVEEQLAFWCVTTLLDDQRAIEAILETRSASQSSRLTAELLGHVGPERQESMWGSWAERKSEFYQACGQRIAVLTWSEALRISGAEVGIRSKLVSSTFQALRESDVPFRLAAAADLLPTGRDKVVPIVTHSPTDPLLIPAAVYELLNRFDGRNTSDALSEIRSHGVEIGEELLLSLIDYGVLREPDSAG